MSFRCTPCWHLDHARPNNLFNLRTISSQAISSHQRRAETITLPAVPSVTRPTRTRRRPDIAQKISVGRDNVRQQDDLFALFEIYADSQRNYERYGGRNLFQHTYVQNSERLSVLNADFNRIDQQLLMNYVVQHPDLALYRKFREIVDLRRKYVRTVGSKNIEERTDESAARLHADGFLTGLPRLFRNARRETGKLKQARKQNPYTSRSSQFMREETKQTMQNAPYSVKIRFFLSPDAQSKEQLRILMRWLKLSEIDKLNPRPFLTPLSRQELKYALEETHKLKLYHKRLFQMGREVCKAISIVLACAFFAWKAGSGLVARWLDSNRQAA